MICNAAVNKNTPVSGLALGGTSFIEIDSDAAAAVYEKNGRVCGVAYECGKFKPFLRVTPAYHLPRRARDKEAWNRFVWGLDNELALGLRLDARCGEISLAYEGGGLEDAEGVSSAIATCVEYLTSDDFHQKVVDYVRSQYRER